MAVRMMMGATRITVVALGRNAQIGATRATIPRRNRLPLPRVRIRKRVPMFSKIPVGSRVRATTMPPNSSASGSWHDPTEFITSSRPYMPKAVSVHTPSRAARTMSIQSKAMARMTPIKTTRMRMLCGSLSGMSVVLSRVSGFLHQRSGGAHISPPCFESRFAPRSSRSGPFCPRLRSNISP